MSLFAMPEEYVEGALVRALMEAELDVPTIVALATTLKPSDQARWRVMDRAIRSGPKVERRSDVCLEAVKVLYSAGYPIPANGVYLAYCDELPMGPVAVNQRAKAMARLLKTLGAGGEHALLKQCLRFETCCHHIPFVQALIDLEQEPSMESMDVPDAMLRTLEAKAPSHAMGAVYTALSK